MKMYSFVDSLRYSQKNNGEKMTADWLENHFFYVTQYGTFLNSLASLPDVEVFDKLIREGKNYYPMSERAKIHKKREEKSKAEAWAQSVLTPKAANRDKKDSASA